MNRSEFDPFSSRFGIKTMRKRDQIRAEIKSNIGSLNTPHLLFAYPRAKQNKN